MSLGDIQRVNDKYIIDINYRDFADLTRIGIVGVNILDTIRPHIDINTTFFDLTLVNSDSCLYRLNYKLTIKDHCMDDYSLSVNYKSGDRISRLEDTLTLDLEDFSGNYSNYRMPIIGLLDKSTVRYYDTVINDTIYCDSAVIFANCIRYRMGILDSLNGYIGTLYLKPGLLLFSIKDTMDNCGVPLIHSNIFKFFYQVLPLSKKDTFYLCNLTKQNVNSFLQRFGVLEYFSVDSLLDGFRVIDTSICRDTLEFRFLELGLLLNERGDSICLNAFKELALQNLLWFRNNQFVSAGDLCCKISEVGNYKLIYSTMFDTCVVFHEIESI